jgi:hypothetical protein
MKTYLRFNFANDINLPRKNFCATLNIAKKEFLCNIQYCILLTVTCRSTTHRMHCCISTATVITQRATQCYVMDVQYISYLVANIEINFMTGIKNRYYNYYLDAVLRVITLFYSRLVKLFYPFKHSGHYMRHLILHLTICPLPKKTLTYFM